MFDLKALNQQHHNHEARIQALQDAVAALKKATGATATTTASTPVGQTGSVTDPNASTQNAGVVVNNAAGVYMDDSGIGAELGQGMLFDANGNIIPSTDPARGVAVDGGGIYAVLMTNGGIQFVSGAMALQLASNGGLVLTSGALQVLADGARGIGEDSSGIFAKLGTGLSFDGSGNIQTTGGGGGGGVKSTLVQQQIVTGSPVSSITFSGLTGIVDGGYRLELALIPGNTSNMAIALEVNGDSTLANYANQYATSYSTLQVAGVATPSNTMLYTSGGGALCTAFCDIAIANGLVNFVSLNRFVQSRYEMVGCMGSRYTYSISDITSLVLQGYNNGATTTLANCFGVGTVANLFRKIT